MDQHEIFQDDDPDETAFQAWRQAMWDLAMAVVSHDEFDAWPERVRQALARLDKTPNPY